jgi:peptide/nickel transport system substrate-binding protein
MKHLFRGGRRKVAAVMAVALVASLSQVAPTSAAGPVRGGEVTILIGDPMAEYCPSNNGGNGSLHTFNMVYEPLLQMTQGGKLVPYLAESVTSKDNKVWTIKVRSGIKFHSGEALDATAVIANITVGRNLGFLPKIAGGPGFPFKLDSVALKGAFAGNIADVKALDAMTVQVTLTLPQRDYPELLYASGRNALLAPSQLAQGIAGTCSTKPIGTGPFMIDGVSTANETVFKANPNYWRNGADGKPLPYLSKITVKYVSEGAQRMNALRSGTAQMAAFTSSVGAKQVKSGQANKSLTLYKSPAEYYTTAWLNTSIEPFKHKSCRLAWAYGFDNKTLAKVGSQGLDTPLTGLFAEGSKMYVKYPYTFDLNKAKAEFKKCQTDTGKTDIAFTVPAGTDSAAKDYAQLVVNQLKKVGFNASVEQMLTAVQIDRVFASNNLTNNGLQVMEGRNTTYWNSTFLKSTSTDCAVHPFGTVAAYKAAGLDGFCKSVFPLLNLTRHQDATVNQAFRDAQAASSDAALAAGMKKAVKKFQDEAYAVPNAALTYYYYTSNKVKGIEDFRLINGAKTQTVFNWGFLWNTAYLEK